MKIEKRKGLSKLWFLLFVMVALLGFFLIVTNSNVFAASKKLKVTAAKKVAVNCEMKIKTNMSATFKSSNRKIATVNKKGVVVGKKAGKVTITVKAKKNKKLVKKIKITVKNQLVVKNPQKKKVTMQIGEKLNIKTNLSVKYKVNNKNVKVSKTGVVTAQKVGTSKITITSKKYKKLKKKITIVVKEKNEKTTEDKTSEDATTEKATTEDKTSEEVTTENKTTEESTTEKSTTEETTTEEATTEESTTEETTTEDTTTEESTTEETTTEDTTTEDATTEEDTTGDIGDENKTGYSRIEWLQAVMNAVEIETLTMDNVKKNSIHKPIYSSHDAVSEETKLVIETGITQGIVEVEQNEYGFALFYPEQAITREDAAVMAVKALKYIQGNEMPECSDVSSLKYPYWDRIAINKDMISLIDGAFCGDQLLSVEDGEQMLSVIKQIYEKDNSAPEEIQEVEYNEELVMDTVADLTSYTVEESEDGYIITLPLVDTEELGIVAGKTVYFPADEADLYPDGLPCNVASVETIEENVIITATMVTDITDVFEHYHMSGQTQALEFIPADGVTVVSSESDSAVYGARSGASSQNTKENKNESVNLSLGKITLTKEIDGNVLKFDLSTAPTINFDFVGNVDGIEYMKLTIEQTSAITFKASRDITERFEADLGTFASIPLGKGFELGGKLVAVVSVNGEVSYEVQFTSEVGFEYDEYFRSIGNNAVSENSNIQASLEIMGGPEIYIYWFDEKLTVVDVSGFAGVGAKVECTTGVTSDAQEIECKERSVYGFLQLEAGTDKDSLLYKVLDKLKVQISWRLAEVTWISLHYESVISFSEATDFKPVKYCSAVKNTLSGKVLSQNNELVPYAYIRIEGVTDSTIVEWSCSDVNGFYDFSAPLAEGKYHITAYWDGHIRCDEIAELNADKFAGYDIIETALSKQGVGYSWIIDAEGFFDCQVDETASMEEVKKDIQDCKSSIKRVKMRGIVGNQSIHNMFENMYWTESIDLSELDTSNVTWMKSMFSGSRYLTNLDLGELDTSNVRSMNSMFRGCSSLTDLDLSSFDTSKVTDMQFMFCECSSLTDLDLSGFDTSAVTDMRYMFSSCSNLTDLDLSGFNTSAVTDMRSMFSSCSNLTDLDLSSFDTSAVTNMGGMFLSCSSLTCLDLSNFDTSNVTIIGCMFSECSNLINLDISNFSTHQYLTSLKELFYNCSSLTSLNLKNFETSDVTSMEKMFYNCSSLTSLDLSSFETSAVTNMASMFYNCSSLTSVDLSSFETSAVTNMASMFYNCSSLTSVDLSSFETSAVTNMGSMFSGCSSLTSVDLSSFDTSNVMDMSYMFVNCENLTSLDLSNFDTSNVMDMSYMFGGCENLTSLDLSNFDTSNVRNMSYMFANCENLTSLDLSNFDTINVKDMTGMFSWCPEDIIPDWYVQ